MDSRTLHPEAHPAPELNTRVQQQVNLRVMAARRRRVMLQIFFFLLVSAALVLVVMWRRDQQAIERCRHSVESIANALRDEIAQRRPLPLGLPIDPRERGHYLYTPLNANLVGTGKPIGLCCCAAAHTLFLMRANGRHVILVSGDRLEVRWVSEAEFAARADEWNLHPPSIH